jgi:nucleoside phosphorylase
VPTGRRGHARVAVLTVIEDEFDALQNALGATHEVGATSVFAPVAPDGPKPQLPFVLARCAHRSNMPAQSSAGRMIEDWRPEILVLVGIAGGVMRARVAEDGIGWIGAKPGDIVLAEYIHYAEFTKNIQSESKLRYFPIDQPTSALVQAHGDALRLAGQGEGAWHEALPVDRPDDGVPALHIGEIVAVEGIAGDPMNAHQKTYLERFDHAAAVDMESGGVARALHEARSDVHYNPRWMCIRAISDRVYAAISVAEGAALPPSGNDEERRQWKAYAAAAAGAFSRRLIERLLAEPREPLSADPGANAFGRWE